MMRTRTGGLLAELHAHTTWSDGALSVGALVDLYGARGFDLLCITDHACPTDGPWRELTPRGITATNHAAYLAELDREAARAVERYGLLVVPGLELTYNESDPAQAAHALALGLRSFVSVDEGIDGAIETAVQAGAALVAAHPYDVEEARAPRRLEELDSVRPRRGDGDPAPALAAAGLPHPDRRGARARRCIELPGSCDKRLRRSCRG